MTNNTKESNFRIEKLVPTSCVEAISVNPEDNAYVVEFAFFRNEDVLHIDVSKRLTKKMVEDLIESLSKALEQANQDGE